MPLGAPTRDAKDPSSGLLFKKLPFSSLPGWDQDDHLAALHAFQKAARPILAAKPSAQSVQPSPALLDILRLALTLDLGSLDRSAARLFFEAHFLPNQVCHETAPGLLTGYYEPVLDGSRVQDGPFQIPVYRRPPDLENIVAESERGAAAHGLTHARRTASGLEPYSTRQEIEEGALTGLALELVWLADPVDCFFMHVQGSGRIRLPDGSLIRISYDGKNGHPYTSIGRYLIDHGFMTADDMSLDALRVWLSADRERGRFIMWQNRSFVFFRELKGAEADSALGALHIPLWAGRSLAVDTAYHALGTPIYVTAPTLTHATGAPFNRIMIASDVGSAIRGPERGDIYFGSGGEAGSLAGITKHPGNFIVLMPKST